MVVEWPCCAGLLCMATPFDPAPKRPLIPCLASIRCCKPQNPIGAGPGPPPGDPRAQPLPFCSWLSRAGAPCRLPAPRAGLWSALGPPDWPGQRPRRPVGSVAAAAAALARQHPCQPGTAVPGALKCSLDACLGVCSVGVQHGKAAPHQGLCNWIGSHWAGLAVGPGTLVRAPCPQCRR